MQRMSKSQYQKQLADCDGLCTISDEMLDQKSELMHCVTCPFCSKTVSAILKPTTISCPECKVAVER